MLNPIGEVVPVKVISPEEAARREGVPCSLLYRLIYKFKAHSLDYWDEDPNNPESLPRANDTGLVHKIFQGVSNLIDGTPYEESLIFAYEWVFNNILAADENGNLTLKLTPYGKEFIAKTCIKLALSPYKEEIVAIAIACIVVIGALILEDKIEKLIEQLDKIIEIVANEFKQKLGELKGTIDKVKNDMIKNWYSIKDNIKNVINPAYNYSTNNPYIRVNTKELREYAYKIGQINETIKGLDYRLDLLYTNARLLDVWDLIQADVILGYSYRLANCKNYLNETAEAFEKAETNIINL